MRFKSRHDNPTLQLLAQCVHEIEARTEAEVALVIRRKSGMYRDVDYLVGAAFSFGLVLFMLFSSEEFAPLSIALPLLLAFGVGARLSQASGRYGPRRYLTSRRRRERQVHRAATACFHDKKIDQIPEGTGILLYFSALEQRAELVVGASARLALGKHLEELRLQLQLACSGERTVHGSVERLGEFLRTLGVLLGQVMPCGEQGHRTTIDDTPDLGGQNGPDGPYGDDEP